MVTTGGNIVFLDTNILVYASIPESPLHDIAVNSIQTLEQDGQELWISRQILREFLATLTRPQVFTEPVPARLVVEATRQFETRFQIAEDNQRVTARLLALMEQVAIGGRQVHDANIVATMQAYGINQLLTHNVTDFERFAALINVLPLVENEE
ncbi:type II toxin-antitoxin system VapC family toxin [Kovacikia minuta CCNUW1]|uniref:type II toxin-antitoxin system VapC family toxin n=1 Tax=Kovacikia minuta TaxID=2931930 RepID=UPI001CCE1DC9|nr:type II toxin-antitoxin system VapC family toxin [Kovacikia minuta]UBF29267.1 type II toxin-antitoxin system VapC family toxin [Kovacikia minuta CCNUW1]